MSTRTVSRVSSSFVAPKRQLSRVPYLPGLDGMRALAVIAVMLYHANHDWLSGGFLGVEVFFVISGYLITLLLIGEHERNGRIRLGQFWLRRIRRLLPAVLTMMAAVAVYMALFNREPQGRTRGDFLGGIFYVSNWYQIFVGQGYTAERGVRALRHLWSLAVEEQFYLIWPLVMVGILRARSPPAAPGRRCGCSASAPGSRSWSDCCSPTATSPRRARPSDERLLDAVRSLHQHQRGAVPRHIQPSRWTDDGRGVRDGVAADGVDARAGCATSRVSSICSALLGLAALGC